MSAFVILPQWLIVSAKEPPRAGWGVRILGDVIDDVAPCDELRSKYPDDRMWEAEDQVLSPGFVNTHTHMYGVLAHGIPLEKAPSGFWPFLKDFWWPMVEDRLDHDMIRAAAHWQCAIMIKSGVTSFYDCLEAPNALPGCLEVEAQVVSTHGLRAILSFEATERLSKENGQLGLKENYDFASQAAQQRGLTSGLMCFHTTFTCSREFILQAFEMAQDLGAMVHMHCSEGVHEPAYAIEHFGKRPLHYYDELGVASKDMLASQCVQLSKDEVALIAERGVRVAHMPLSNCEVGGGIAPIPELVAAGVPLGLGSDSYIDDFFQVMRGACLIHKAKRLDPRVMPADLVWYLATEGGAHALGLEKIGRIESGWQADLVLIDAVFPTPAEAWNLYDQLVLYRSPSHVAAVIVAGETLLEGGVLRRSDEDRLRAETHRAAERLWSKARET